MGVIIESTVSHVRPVLMATITTILGMIPLLFDVVFGGMAATIVFGLSFATLLTLFVTPALYAIFYRVKKIEMYLFKILGFVLKIIFFSVNFYLIHQCELINLPI